MTLGPDRGRSARYPDGRKEPLSGRQPGFDNFFNGYFWRMCEHDGWLYMGTFEWSSILGYVNRSRWPEAFANVIAHVNPQNILDYQSGFDLYRSFDGENWVPVSTNGLGNPLQMGFAHLRLDPARACSWHRQPVGPKIMPIDGSGYRIQPARRLRGPPRPRTTRSADAPAGATSAERLRAFAPASPEGSPGRASIAAGSGSAGGGFRQFPRGWRRLMLSSIAKTVIVAAALTGVVATTSCSGQTMRERWQQRMAERRASGGQGMQRGPMGGRRNSQ